MTTRCGWAKNELSIAYHDSEWGVPAHDDRRLFEFLILEAAQAGLSWDTILRKRENYRAAFDDFDAEKIARYDERKLSELLQNEGIVRNRLKIASAVQNAKSFSARSILTSGVLLTGNRSSIIGKICRKFRRKLPFRMR